MFFKLFKEKKQHLIALKTVNLLDNENLNTVFISNTHFLIINQNNSISMKSFDFPQNNHRIRLKNDKIILNDSNNVNIKSQINNINNNKIKLKNVSLKLDFYIKINVFCMVQYNTSDTLMLNISLLNEKEESLSVSTWTLDVKSFISFITVLRNCSYKNNKINEFGEVGFFVFKSVKNFFDTIDYMVHSKEKLRNIQKFLNDLSK